ncbi:acyltransferase family protein [Gleimia coleocanis]|uniref:acyltransferase family protein n=1 Tax=Gleimia coleocanis TaxID=103618 RepID=UPI00030D6AE5|nr:acyltransferase [Gleimia coleocanis]
MKNKPRATINSIQFLRAFAALAVVYYHIAILDFGKALKLPETGAWGVDIFFVISGFIIGMVAFQNNQKFLQRRIIRVVPLYWLATFMWAGLALALPEKTNSTVVTAETLLKSMFFIPFEMPLRVGPLLGQGWTLNYEMFFYLFVALTLWIFKDAPKALAATGVSLVVLVGTSWYYVPQNFALLHYQNPLLLEFVAGMVLYFIFRWYTTLNLPPMLRIGLVIPGVVLFAVGIYLMVAQDTSQMAYLFDQRAGFYGIPAFLTVVGTLLLEPLFRPGKLTMLLLELGAGSYAIYLFHGFIVGLLGPSFFGGLAGPEAPGRAALLIATTMALSALSGVVINKYFDEALQRVLKKFLR